MDEQARWEEKGRLARTGLAPLEFLMGKWVGRGTSHGAPVTGELEVRHLMDGTWLEARETLFDASGQVEHTDLCLYRFDVEQGRLEVVHLMGHAHMGRHPVEPVGRAFHWITGPAAPRLSIAATDEGLHMEVQFPGAATPAVTMKYRSP